MSYLKITSDALRHRKNLIRAVLIILGIAPSLAISILTIVNHFAVDGPYLLDTGWYVGLLASDTLYLENPEAIAGQQPSSYYSSHFSPLFVALAAIRQVLGLHPALYTALFFIIVHTVVAVTALVLVLLSKRRDILLITVAALFSALMPLNIAYLNHIGFPHPETLFVFLGPIVLLSLLLGRYWIAGICGLSVLTLREDMGFHLFAFTFPYALLMSLRNRNFKELTPVFAFSAIFFLTSFIAIATQKVWFPGDDAAARIYFGSPPYAHLTYDFLIDRISNLMHKRPDFWALLACSCLCAIFDRDPGHLLGPIAVTPWFLLNLTAFSTEAGRLGLYYGFPILAATFWPLVVILARKNADQRRASTILMIMIITLLPTLQIGRAKTLKLPPSVDIGALEIMADLAENVHELKFHSSVASLAPKQVSIERIIETAPDQPFAVVFFRSALGTDKLATASHAIQADVFRIGNSPVLLASTRPDIIAGVNVILKKHNITLHQTNIPVERLKSNGSMLRTGNTLELKKRSGLMLFGPFLDLAKGQYKLSAIIESQDCHSCSLRIDAYAGGVVLSEMRINLPSGTANNIVFNFDLPANTLGLETRIWSDDRWSGRIRGFDIVSVPLP